jgi:hypothetical protein
VYSGVCIVEGVSCCATYIFLRGNKNKTVRIVDLVLLCLEMYHRYPCVSKPRVRPVPVRHLAPYDIYCVETFGTNHFASREASCLAQPV